MFQTLCFVNSASKPNIYFFGNIYNCHKTKINNKKGIKWEKWMMMFLPLIVLGLFLFCFQMFVVLLCFYFTIAVHFKELSESIML